MTLIGSGFAEPGASAIERETTLGSREVNLGTHRVSVPVAGKAFQNTSVRILSFRVVSRAEAAREAAFAPQDIQAPIQSRKKGYGRSREAGQVVFAHRPVFSRLWHVVVAFMQGEIEAVETWWVGTAPITMDPVLPGEPAEGELLRGWVRIFAHLGAADQAADERLIDLTELWSADHRLHGIFYAYMQGHLLSSKFDGETFDQLTVVGRWSKVFDPRAGTTVWREAPPLAVRDVLVDTDLGLGRPAAEMDDTAIAQAADDCEAAVGLLAQSAGFWASASADLLTLLAGLDLVTGDSVTLTTTGTLPAPLSAGTTYYWVHDATARGRLATSYADALAGTAIKLTDAGTGDHTIARTNEPRYRVGGLIDSARRPTENLRALLAAMAGTLVWSGGKFVVHAGLWRAPAVTLTEDDLLEPPDLTTRLAPQERVNRVKAIYRAPGREWKEDDAPVVRDAAAESADGGIRSATLDVRMVPSHTQAQRLAKIRLKAGRREARGTMVFGLTAYRLRAGDTFAFDFAPMAWTGKAFLVERWALVSRGGAEAPKLGVRLQVVEIVEADFAWDAASEERSIAERRRVEMPTYVTEDKRREEETEEDRGISALRLENAREPDGSVYVGSGPVAVWNAPAVAADDLEPQDDEHAGVRDFRVRVWEADLLNQKKITARRREAFVAEPRYDYSLGRNWFDAVNDPPGQITSRDPIRKGWIECAVRRTDGRIGPARSIYFDSPLPPAPADVAGVASTGDEQPYVEIRVTRPEGETGIVGTLVFASESEGFTPAASNLLWASDQDKFRITGLKANTKVYFRFAHFDELMRGPRFLERLDAALAADPALPVTAEFNVTTPGAFTEVATVGGQTVLWDVSALPKRALQLVGDITMAAPTNVIEGEPYQLELAQDTTGGRQVTFDAAGYEFPGGDDGVSTTAGAVTHLACIGRSGKLRCVAQPDFKAQGA